MASDRGAIKKSHKLADGDPPIPLPSGVWVAVARFTPEDVGSRTLGWSVMDGELYSDLDAGYGLPAVLPKSTEARWLRHVGKGSLDPTKRTPLLTVVKDWGHVVPATIEYLTPGDFPLELQIKSVGGGLWHVTTAIAAIVAPATYAASRLTIGED